MILLYWLIGYLILPILPILLHKKAKKNKNYAHNWSERFMLGSYQFDNNIIWFHSVSVGETRAMQKMIELMCLNYPNYKILITVMTPTGRDTANLLYPECIVKYVPYDVFHIVNKFLKIYKPLILILMETELWPTLISLCYKKNIPIVLANARLSNKSFNNYHKIRFFIKPIINKINLILCQDINSKNNFTKLSGIENLSITGNTKFDLISPNITSDFIKLKDKLKDKKIVVFASSRENEEKIFIDLIKDRYDDILFIIVPRHPERFDIVENLLLQQKITYQKRTDMEKIEVNIKVLLGNSMGEMFNYYYLSDIAIIGGSFLNYGGQNPIESIFLNKPVIFGKHMFNFNDIANNIIINNCGLVVENLQDCLLMIEKIYDDNNLYNKMSQNCNKFMQQYVGASFKNIQYIRKLIM
jgi:3-deoxy-D-manno-octulosonic-acid transferase